MAASIEPRRPPVAAAPVVIVVMGVAGSGQDDGRGRRWPPPLGWRFVDADDHHAPASVAKMARGEPLDDADRWPWLDRLRAIIDGGAGGGRARWCWPVRR